MSSTPLWLPLAAAGLAVVGTLGGVLVTQVLADRREDKAWRRKRETEQEDRWLADRRSYYRPLLEAAYDLRTRLEYLARIYQQEQPGAPFTPESLSADFRELYRLSRDPITDLYGTDPNQFRHDDQAVQRLRTRMCRELNFATSTVYYAARFLGWAQANRRLLEEGRTSLPAQPTKQLRDQLAAVSGAWQGPGGAGLSTEQHESIGEMMLTTDGNVITQFEFRKRLLELPGWEQYTALLTFFLTENDNVEDYRFAVRFKAKVDHEVRATVAALSTLIASLDQISALADLPPDWKINIAAVSTAPGDPAN